jgi:hypothetical protein
MLQHNQQAQEPTQVIEKLIRSLLPILQGEQHLQGLQQPQEVQHLRLIQVGHLPLAEHIQTLVGVQLLQGAVQDQVIVHIIAITVQIQEVILRHEAILDNHTRQAVHTVLQEVVHQVLLEVVLLLLEAVRVQEVILHHVVAQVIGLLILLQGHRVVGLQVQVQAEVVRLPDLPLVAREEDKYIILKPITK